MSPEGARSLRLGDWIWYDEGQHQVVAHTGTGVQLLSSTGQWTGISTAMLLAAPGFRFLSGAEAAAEESKPNQPDLPALMKALEPDKRSWLFEHEADLLEALTGYRSGDPERPLPGEPRPAYDPAKVPGLRKRVEAKADELGIGVATLWRHLRRYREVSGPEGLIDRRGSQVRNPLPRADPRLIEAIIAQHGIEVEDSTGSLNRFCRRLGDRLDHTYGPGAVTMPSQSTIARYIEILLPGQHTLGRATTRRTQASRPDRTYRRNPAVRPGQVVMIDATPLDVVAYDPTADVTHKVRLVAAIDVATRTLLARRMTIGDTRAVDTALLLLDAITPEPMRPGWRATIQYSMLRLPTKRLADLDERLELAAARPVIWPEEILVDHAKVNISDALRSTCNKYGISLGMARKANPIDKANIERAFDTVREQFSEHVAGYKGPEVTARGRGVEATARWRLEELEEFFAEYVVCTYQRRTHSGLVVPGFPELELSPNEAYAQAVARFGLVMCPPKTFHYCDHLPIDWRTIRPEGVQRNYLIYDADILKNHRRELSPIPGKGRRWPVRYHPNDPTRVFIFLEDAWHALFWTHLPDPTVPFTSAMVEQAVQAVMSGERRAVSQQDIADELLELQRRMDAPEASTAKTRRELVRARDDARTIRRDHAQAGLVETDDRPPLRLVPPPERTSDKVFTLEEIEDAARSPASRRERR